MTSNTNDRDGGGGVLIGQCPECRQSIARCKCYLRKNVLNMTNDRDDRDGGGGKFESMPAIKLCSRWALDEFLRVYWPELLRDLDAVTTLRAEVERLRGELDDNERSSEIHWDCSMRAIKRWQEAHPGNDLRWPDGADLLVWLMERLAQAEAQRDEMAKAARDIVGDGSFVMVCGEDITKAHVPMYKMNALRAALSATHSDGKEGT